MNNKVGELFLRFTQTYVRKISLRLRVKVLGTQNDAIALKLLDERQLQIAHRRFIGIKHLKQLNKSFSVACYPLYKGGNVRKLNKILCDMTYRDEIAIKKFLTRPWKLSFFMNFCVGGMKIENRLCRFVALHFVQHSIEK
ncbi:CLUMA_CG015042, isoform A [Clunio marinus]|uniref:CLUMA_CG015042, isoform A n=1 Tax=Clunio marinus TaxID=568069 RepID=A0A1J1INM0_9DIPT|nr:CLUMA_CG015042, isoform A [Clunio marinus]